MDDCILSIELYRLLRNSSDSLWKKNTSNIYIYLKEASCLIASEYHGNGGFGLRMMPDS